MKMKRLTSILLLLVAGSQAYAYDSSSLKGAVSCTSTSTSAVNRQLNLSGSISLVADGQGNFTTGNASYYFTQDNVNAVCYWKLTVGNYIVNADGSGTATTNWSLLPGSTPGHCSETVIRYTPRLFSIPSGKFWAPAGTNSDESGTCTLAQ
jgi:hypothetical protein